MHFKKWTIHNDRLPIGLYRLLNRFAISFERRSFACVNRYSPDLTTSVGASDLMTIFNVNIYWKSLSCFNRGVSKTMTKINVISQKHSSTMSGSVVLVFLLDAKTTRQRHNTCSESGYVRRIVVWIDLTCAAKSSKIFQFFGIRCLFSRSSLHSAVHRPQLTTGNGSNKR